MTDQELTARLSNGEVVPLATAEWEALAPGFDVVEEHDTGLSSSLLIVRGPAGLAAVERPAAGQRVARPLPDLAAVGPFVADRLRAYERMWDGCGCRIDYFR